jgi:hypothetical protein
MAQSPQPYDLVTRPCTIHAGRFRWDIRENGTPVQSSMESFASEQEAHADGRHELEKLIQVSRLWLARHGLGLRAKKMIATSHGRRSWKDNPKAKTIAATVSLLLITGLIAVLAFALLSMQWSSPSACSG